MAYTVRLDPENPGVSYGSTNIVYPLSFSYGYTSFKPGDWSAPGVGEMMLYLDNSALDWGDLNTTLSDNPEIGLNTGFTIVVEDTGDTDINVSMGSLAKEWNALPGLVDELLVEVVGRDFIHELQTYTLEDISPQENKNVAELFAVIVSSDILTTMPDAQQYSTNGESMPTAFQDMTSGRDTGYAALARVAASEMGHYYCEDGSLVYKTHQDWINLGRTSIGTLDNQYLDIEIDKPIDLMRNPIYVHYYPATKSDSVEVLYQSEEQITLTFGQTVEIAITYSHPEDASLQVSCVDSDIVDPVRGTDLFATYTEGSTDNDADTNMTYTYTNSLQGGILTATYGGIGFGEDAYLTVAQIRGTPIYMDDEQSIYKNEDIDGTAFVTPLSVKLPYIGRAGFSGRAASFFRRAHGSYPSKSIVRSISILASADSDMMTMALNGKLGSTVRIIEDVNSIDDYYRITSADWMLYGPNEIVVTWDVYPSDYTCLHMVDEDDARFTDSDGTQFAFWR